MRIVQTLAGEVAVRFDPGGEWLVLGRHGNVHRSPVEFGVETMPVRDHEREIDLLIADYDERFHEAESDARAAYEHGYAEGYDRGYREGRQDASADVDAVLVP